MPDEAYVRHKNDLSNPEKAFPWKSVGEVSHTLVQQAVSRKEYDAAPMDEEGFRHAWAECRKCDAPVRVLAYWNSGEAQVYGHGRKPGCDRPRCGEKCPVAVIRMATESEVSE